MAIDVRKYVDLFSVSDDYSSHSAGEGILKKIIRVILPLLTVGAIAFAVLSGCQFIFYTDRSIEKILLFSLIHSLHTILIFIVLKSVMLEYKRIRIKCEEYREEIQEYKDDLLSAATRLVTFFKFSDKENTHSKAPQNSQFLLPLVGAIVVASLHLCYVTPIDYSENTVPPNLTRFISEVFFALFCSILWYRMNLLFNSIKELSSDPDLKYTVNDFHYLLAKSLVHFFGIYLLYVFTNISVALLCALIYYFFKTLSYSFIASKNIKDLNNYPMLKKADPERYEAQKTKAKKLYKKTTKLRNRLIVSSMVFITIILYVEPMQGQQSLGIVKMYKAVERQILD